MADFDLTSTPVVRPKEDERAVPPAPIFGEGVDLSSAPIGRPLVRPEDQPDYGEAAKSGLMKLPLAAVGMAGDVEQLIKASPMLGVQAWDWARGKLGIPRSEEEKQRALETAQRISGYIGERQEKGPLPGLGVPYAKPVSTQEMVEAVNPALERRFGVGPGTEFTTPEENILREGLAGVSTGLAGPLRGMARRGFTGFSGGAGSEAGGEWAKDTSWEVPARLAGAVLGTKAGEKTIQYFPGRGLIPEFGGKERLATTLSDYGADSSAAARRMSETPDIAAQAAASPSRMRSFTQQLTGVNPRAADYVEELERLGRLERDRVYDLARSMPNAGQISDPLIDALRDRPSFKKAEALAAKRAEDLPDWDIRPPVEVPGTPAGKWVQTPQGLKFQGPQTATPASMTPGNLNYYDQVKKELDGIIEQAKRTGDTETLVAARKSKEDLLGVLDNIVPEYKTARGVAADTFQAASAPEAGARFLTTFDDYDKKDFTKAFRSYNPEQRRAFAVGMMNQLEDDLQRNPKRVVDAFLNKDFTEKMGLAFGRENAAAIRAKVLSENLVLQANRLRERMASAQSVQSAGQTALSSGLKGAAATGAAGLGTAAYTNLEPIMHYLTAMGVPPGTQTAALGIGLATAASTAAFNSVERRIARQMVDLATSTNPRTFARLNQLIENHPQVYNKLVVPVMSVNAGLEAAGERKHGGRVARKAGGRISAETEAERLVRAAESAKKNIGKGTEEILNAPDERVVKALKVANEQFEG